MNAGGARDVLRAALGPAVRRARRELQWHTPGTDFRVRRSDVVGFPHVVAEHATPLIRALSGVDPQLQHNKVVNLRIAVQRLNGVVIDPGVRLSFWHEVGKPTYWPSLDLQIENRTAEPYHLRVSLTQTHLAGAWLSTAAPAVTYRIEEREHRITHDGPGMFVRHNELWRIEYALDGAFRGERIVAANDALMMYEPFLPPAAVP